MAQISLGWDFVTGWGDLVSSIELVKGSRVGPKIAI